MLRRRMVAYLVIGLTVACSASVWGKPFHGFDSSSLAPVADTAGQWGLKIVVLDVGQADAIPTMAPNGDVTITMHPKGGRRGPWTPKPGIDHPA